MLVYSFREKGIQGKMVTFKPAEENAVELKTVIQNALLKKLPEAEVYIVDPDGKHLDAVVVDVSFSKMPLLERHRLVKRQLKPYFEDRLHALSLHTYTPEEWEKQKPELKGALHEA